VKFYRGNSSFIQELLMKMTVASTFLFGALALSAALYAHAANVDISLDLFPTNPANPGGGGNFSIYAKTDAPLGIAAINLYLSNVSQTGLTPENDIAALLIGGKIPSTAVTGGLNILYGQDTAGGPLVFGVGTATKSDGSDPLGNPVWNGATKILSGIYGPGLPAFIPAGSNHTDSNVFVFSGTAPLPAGSVVAAMNVTTTVRVASVPEPLALGLKLTGLGTVMFVRRR
jgi:hypothetical protein